VNETLDKSWEKPVLVFYRERRDQPERKAFAVVKTRKLVVSRVEGEIEVNGTIDEFFPLMGDIDDIATGTSSSERYVLCWFDDDEDDVANAWRRLTGVTFPNGVTRTTNDKGKRTYHATFRVPSQ
jgi:hypothetical protein